MEQEIEAYRDGALSARRARRVERAIAEDAEAARHLQAGTRLSGLIAEAWTEGPPSPPPERFLAAIRPELQRIDAERARRAAAAAEARWSARWAAWLRPAPLAGATAFAATAALLLVVSGLQGWGPEPAPREFTRTGSSPALAFSPGVDALTESAQTRHALAGMLPTRSAVYDVRQGDANLLIYDGEDDSPLLIFALPGEARDASAQGSDAR